MPDGFTARTLRRRLQACAGVWVISLIAAAVAMAQPTLPIRPSLKPDASDGFFAAGQIPRLKIELGPAELRSLRENARTYTKCKVIENDSVEFPDVGIKLKGASGSFRSVDERPGLTLNFDKYRKKQLFHGLDKIHLNNSVQDASYLNELISTDLFLAAGVPACRATNAVVTLNGRQLGFYVLKEGFNSKFLKRHFADGSGNLYDSGLGGDIAGNLEKDSGDGVDDQSDLKALVAACRLDDPLARQQQVGELLDVDAFLSMMAMELMTCHWDGSCNNRNNYRVYFNPTNKKAYFLPHGMDQMFRDTNFSFLHVPPAAVSQITLQNPQWRAKYRERVSELIKLFDPPDRLLARIDQVHARIRPVIASLSEQAAKDHDSQVKLLKDRITARAQTLVQQMTAPPDPRLLKFSAEGIARLGPWATFKLTADTVQTEVTVDGVKALRIATGPSNRCDATWRMKVVLGAGSYRLKGRVKTAGVVGVADPAGAGAGLRHSAGVRTNTVEGTTEWQWIEHNFTISSIAQETELAAELRSTAGSVWFDIDSLQLIKKL